MDIEHANLKSLNYKGFKGSINFDKKNKLHIGTVIIDSKEFEYSGKSIFDINNNFKAVIDKLQKRNN